MQLKLKKAHKEATIMYDGEVGKEKGGMLVRQVEEFVKKKIVE